MVNRRIASTRPPRGRYGFVWHSCAWALLIALGASLCSAQPNGLTIKGPVPWIDVMAYGATGDGTTDDKTAIQNAINACPSTATIPLPANPGCTVFFPLGTYKIGGTSGLVIDTTRPGVMLQGQCAVIGVGTSC